MVRTKFSDVQQMLLEAFPDDKVSFVEVAKLLRSAFPSANAKRETKGKKEMFYVGVERCANVPQGASLDVQQRHERATNEMLSAKVTRLEQEVESMQQANVPVATCKEELLLLISESSVLCSGPDSLEHLESFSLSSIIHEIQTIAPNLFSLFSDLGDTKRNVADEKATTNEDIKVLTSLCTLTNARSRRSKGVQLFLSIMLIARSVNKQVS